MMEGSWALLQTPEHAPGAPYAATEVEEAMVAIATERVFERRIVVMVCNDGDDDADDFVTDPWESMRLNICLTVVPLLRVSSTCYAHAKSIYLLLL